MKKTKSELETQQSPLQNKNNTHSINLHSLSFLGVMVQKDQGIKTVTEKFIKRHLLKKMIKDGGLSPHLKALLTSLVDSMAPRAPDT